MTLRWHRARCYRGSCVGVRGFRLTAIWWFARRAKLSQLFQWIFAANHRLNTRIPRRQEGRIAIAMKRGAGCDGRGLALASARSRTMKSCGPDAPGLASTPEEASASRGDGDKQLQVTRESAYKP